MLVALRIDNFAIVEAAELEFETGLTALTGETGAGKSLVVDALLLALGERARRRVDPRRRRAGRGDGRVRRRRRYLRRSPGWTRNDLADGSECILRRTVRADGRSRSYVNGRPVAAGLLRELGQLLVDIHGQHAYQALLRPAAQRALLDRYAGAGPLLEAVADAHARWQAAGRALDEAEPSAAGRAERLEQLRYQLRRAGHAGAGRRRVAAARRGTAPRRPCPDAGRGQRGGAAALDDDSAGAYGLLAQAAGQLQRLAGFDARLAEPLTLLDGTLAQLAEAARRCAITWTRWRWTRRAALAGGRAWPR